MSFSSNVPLSKRRLTTLGFSHTSSTTNTSLILGVQTRSSTLGTRIVCFAMATVSTRRNQTPDRALCLSHLQEIYLAAIALPKTRDTACRVSARAAGFLFHTVH